MNFRNLFSRKAKNVVSAKETEKKRIICKSKELIELITSWTQNEKWDFEIFADFMELAGVKTPITLCEPIEKSNSFKCFSADGKEYIVSLRFGDWFDHCSELHITEGFEKKLYTINYNSEEKHVKPDINLCQRTIEKDGKVLTSYYCSYFCNRTLKLDDTHILSIEIEEPKKKEESSETLVLRNAEAVENYLLTLTPSLSVSKIYEEVLSLLNFSAENIFSSEKILISLSEKSKEEEIIKERFFLSYGKIQEYAITEGSESFHIFRNGDFKYYSSDIKIVYSSKNSQYCVSIVGIDNVVLASKPIKRFVAVTEKIAELQQKLAF